MELDWLIILNISHSSNSFRIASGRQKAEDGKKRLELYIIMQVLQWACINKCFTIKIFMKRNVEK